MRVGCIQTCTGVDVRQNIADLTQLVRKACDQGAEFISTPEGTNILQKDRDLLFQQITAQDDDPTIAAMADLARARSVWIHLGSVMVKIGSNKAANRSVLISPDGKVATTYDKIHMFDVDLGGGENYQESATYSPGNQLVSIDVPWGKIGLSVCYDLRFPSQFWRLATAGVGLHLIPAAFTKTTGQAHWHPLLRARAIETGSFVIAAAQGGRHDDGRETYGHSLVIDPWGQVIAEKADDSPGVLMADVDWSRVAECREKIQNLRHERRVIDP